MFVAQYVWGPGVNPYEAFKRSDSNYSQVKKSALALRRRLHQMDRLEEFDSLVKKEEQNNYIVRIDEELDFYLGNLPECWNRWNIALKNSPTTPLRLVAGHNTLHWRSGISINDATVKGRTSINRCDRVLYHFFLHPVPLLLDVRKMYRQIRTRTLTNVLRKFFWFADPHDESTLQEYMLTRLGFGCKEADKIVELIMMFLV